MPEYVLTSTDHYHVPRIKFQMLLANFYEDYSSMYFDMNVSDCQRDSTCTLQSVTTCDM